MMNHPYLPGDGSSLLNSFDNTLTSRAIDYAGSSSISMINDISTVCLVSKNKLLVYGFSILNDRVFELHQFENNSATRVVSIRLLSSEP